MSREIKLNFQVFFKVELEYKLNTKNKLKLNWKKLLNHDSSEKIILLRIRENNIQLLLG